MAAPENNTSPPRDTVAFAFLIAMILVAAVMFGIGMSGVASGTVQDWLRAAGFGATAEIRAELGRQKTAIADVGASLDRTIGEASALGARTQELARNDAAQSERLAKLDEEMAMLKAKFRALVPEDPLESLANGGTDALTLRTTLDALAERNRHEYNALNKRLDYLENMIAPPPDVTGAIRAPEKRRRHGRHGVQGADAARGN
jgi:hypothetical protein